MDQNTKDILEAVNFIKEKVELLPTKDDVRAIVEEVVDEKFRPIHASLTEINRRLDTIEEHYGNLKDVTKEDRRDPRRGARHPKASRHREEDCGLITLVPAAPTLYNSRIN